MAEINLPDLEPPASHPSDSEKFPVTRVML